MPAGRRKIRRGCPDRRGGCDLRLDWGNGEKFAFALWVEDFTLRIVDRLRAAVADRLSRMGPCLT